MASKQSSGRSKKNRAGASSALAPRLAAYSATAAAALAIAPAAQAQVIPITSFTYSGSTTTTPPSFTLLDKFRNLTFSAGPFEMRFTGYHIAKVPDVSTYGGQVFIKGSGSGHNSIHFAGQTYGNTVMKLAPGSIIKLQPNFGASLLASRNNNNPAYRQTFQPHANGAVTGYVGFRATNAGHDYYGWLNVKVTADANGFANSVSIVAANGAPGVFGAYDISTDPNINSFGASQIASVPEPSDAAFGLGLLAFGAAGVREFRRRKQAG